MLPARRAAIAAFAVPRRQVVRSLSSAPRPAPAPEASQSDAGLSKQEEQRERARMVAQVMAEKTMREVAEMAAGRRPEGAEQVGELAGNENRYAANYDDDRDEWGGPKGDEPTRFGDWERNGKAIDF